MKKAGLADRRTP